MPTIRSRGHFRAADTRQLIHLMRTSLIGTCLHKSAYSAIKGLRALLAVGYNPSAWSPAPAAGRYVLTMRGCVLPANVPLPFLDRPDADNERKRLGSSERIRERLEEIEARRKAEEERSAWSSWALATKNKK
jgi:hypothetical protein